MIIGMMHGWFGRKLTDFVNSKESNYYQARRSVNIMDRAELIASFARQWEEGLRTPKWDYK
jgi:putative chitinase